MLDYYKLPLTTEEARQVLQANLERLFPSVQPMPGALKLVKHLKKHRVPMAVRTLLLHAFHRSPAQIATSSPPRNFVLKTQHLTELFDCFEPQCKVHAGHPDLKPGRGKPCPVRGVARPLRP
jgi:pseudouridine-5'-monophosphatase